jgi:hypothetical protein
MFKNLDENQRKKFQRKKFQLKKLNNNKKLAAQIEKKNKFWDITTKPKIGIL